MSILASVKHRLNVVCQDINLRLFIRNRSIKLVIGASGVYQQGWYPTDIQNLNLLIRRNWEKYFCQDSIDAILAEHVWEHLTKEDAFLAAQNCFRFLKPKGYLRIAVPDGYHFSDNYIKSVNPGGSGLGSDDHKVLYNYLTLTKLLQSVGFEVRLLEYFDENHLFHYEKWDSTDGLIIRSSRFDERNKDGNLNYTSLIVDAFKN